MASVSLSIGGTALRIACDRRLARDLKATYRRYLVDNESPLGFVVQRASRRNRRLALLDRCGFNLGSAPDRQRMANMLDSHLTALLPVARSQARFRVRAIIAADGVSLCFFPLLFVPPSAVDQMRSVGHNVVDRLAVEIDSVSGAMAHLADPRVRRDAIERGDAAAATESIPVTRLVFPDANQPLLLPSRAKAVASLCGEAIAGEREQILDAAAAAVEGASLTTASVTEQASLPLAVSVW